MNNSSHSVNGDIAIQWEWSNFDPSQNPNPLTDYDKTLHNWLCPRDEHVIQNLCQSAARERLPKYVKFKVSLFYFFPDSPTEVTRAWNFTHDGSKHALWRKEVPFGGPHDGRQHLGFKFPKNHQKCPSISMFERPRTDSRRMTSQKTDVIGLQSLGGQAAYTIYSILEITAAVYLQYLKRNDSVSRCTIFGTEIQFLPNLYSICRQSVLQVGA